MLWSMLDSEDNLFFYKNFNALEVANSFGFIFNLIHVISWDLQEIFYMQKESAVKKPPYLFKVFSNQMLLHFCS